MTAPNSTRLVAVADLHGKLPVDLPDGDVLAIVGDVLEPNRPKWQVEWLKRHFVPWLRSLPFGTVLLVAGNHDRAFAVVHDGIWRRHLPENVEYLLDRTVSVRGLSFHGTPWTPKSGERWVFQEEDDALAERWKLIPEDVDVLLAHGPPFGICDLVPPDRHIGSRTLRAWVVRVQPPLVVTGHVHEAAGIEMVSRTTVANVSLSGGIWGPTAFNRPAVFDLDSGSVRPVSR